MDERSVRKFRPPIPAATNRTLAAAWRDVAHPRFGRLVPKRDCASSKKLNPTAASAQSDTCRPHWPRLGPFLRWSHVRMRTLCQYGADTVARIHVVRIANFGACVLR
jgi:hypothetical protein